MKTLLFLMLVVVAGPAAALPTPDSEGARRAHFHGEQRPPTSGPRRIVSLSPAITETLFVVGAGPSVVGVTRYCDRPVEARTRTVIGGYTDASLEGIVALSPDLVIAQPSFQQRSLLDRLRDRGVPVLVVFADTVDESADLMATVGRVVGRSAEATALVARQDRALHEVPHLDNHQLRVVVVVGTDPLVVAGHDSFADRAVIAAGVTTAINATDPSWPQWSLETVAARHVDVIVAAEGEAAVARLTRLLQPLGARRPRIVSATTPILMRPGPAFTHDLETLRKLLQAPAPTATP
jgi:iron complex transport system substrate-binding protein